MKITNLLVAAVVSAGLAFSVVAQATEEKGETVQLSSLPDAVQKTIKEKAAGGEIIRVEKEEQKGKWIYEAVVRTGGKEWGLEVDANGKYLGKHDESKEHHHKGEKAEKGEKY